jgi:hypothetical protein
VSIGESAELDARAGPRPARGVLLTVYLAIAVASALLLVVDEPRGVAALLGVQVVCKLLTPLTVGSLRNPVVRSNLAIAAVHSATLVRP